MTKLPDEKLIDKIMEEINDACYDLGNMFASDIIKIENILQKHLTHPTDEGIEKPTKCITADVKPTKEILLGKDEPSQDGDMGCEVYGLVSNNEVLITRIVYLKPVKEVDGIEKEEPIPQCICPDSRCYHWGGPKEVKPPTKDTIEKIGDFKDLYSFPNNPRVGQTCAGYIWNGEHRLEQGFDYMKFECLRTKYNELVDTVNHQQKQIQQLLSGK